MCTSAVEGVRSRCRSRKQATGGGEGHVLFGTLKKNCGHGLDYGGQTGCAIFTAVALVTTLVIVVLQDTTKHLTRT